MLELQKFVLEHSDWEERLAAAPYNLKIQKKNLASGDFYALFRYSQIDSDFAEPIVCEARGVILKIKPDRTSKVVRKAFDKFFNIGEVYAANIHWPSAEATEKWDGSLVSLWYDEGVWNISTLGCIDANDAPLESGGIKTYGELFYKTRQKLKWDFSMLDTHRCYTMELCSQFNPIVVRYDRPQLIHILTIDLDTLEEVNDNIGLPKPKKYKFDSKLKYQELVESFDKSHEGIVVKDKFGNRVKIKSPLYFKLHKMAHNHHINKEKALELIIKNDHWEFLSYFSQYKDFFYSVEKEYKEKMELAWDIQIKVDQWKSFNPSCGRKEFAQWVNRYLKEWSNIAFICYDNKLPDSIKIKTDVRDIMRFYHIKEDEDEKVEEDLS